MKTTPQIVTFSFKNQLVLAIVSTFALAGFLWPFFYSGKDLPKTQLVNLLDVGCVRLGGRRIHALSADSSTLVRGEGGGGGGSRDECGLSFALHEQSH